LLIIAVITFVACRHSTAWYCDTNSTTVLC